MTRAAGFSVAILAALALLAIGLLLLAYLSPMESPGGVVTVQPGNGAAGVASSLSREGLLRYPTAFILFARLTGTDRALQAGRYAVPGSPSIRSLIELLEGGPNLLERVTIPEGSRAKEIAGILAKSAGVDSSAFIALVNDPATPERFGAPGPSLEGYLFPDTYEVPWGIEAAEAASLLVAEYRSVMTPAWIARAESLGYDEREVIVLASIVEAETGVPEERARVSAVFHNRLRDGWKLEADPTVRHATGNFNGGILKSELEFDSPYNTYVYAGLPPGPIGSPGRAAIEAALYPIESREYFFVATGGGGHAFSRTLAQHNRARALARLQAKN